MKNQLIQYKQKLKLKDLLPKIKCTKGNNCHNCDNCDVSYNVNYDLYKRYKNKECVVAFFGFTRKDSEGISYSYKLRILIKGKQRYWIFDTYFDLEHGRTQKFENVAKIVDKQLWDNCLESYRKKFLSNHDFTSSDIMEKETGALSGVELLNVSRKQMVASKWIYDKLPQFTHICKITNNRKGWNVWVVPFDIKLIPELDNDNMETLIDNFLVRIKFVKEI